MNRRSLKLVLFLFVALVQLGVPVSMVVSRERTLSSGEVFRFQVGPVDPYDAFRGRYVALQLRDSTVTLTDNPRFAMGQKAFVTVEHDKFSDFAYLGKLSATPPEGAYMEATIAFIQANRAHLTLPIDRYYMNEKLAPQAEQAYWQRSRQQANDVYIDVRIRNGQAVIEELYIAGKPIVQYLRENPAPTPTPGPNRP